MIEVLRRTFEALKHPAGSTERMALNRDAATSEYKPSYRYLMRWPAMMSDGTPNPAQKFHVRDFRKKYEAENAAHGKATELKTTWTFVS